GPPRRAGDHLPDLVQHQDRRAALGPHPRAGRGRAELRLPRRAGRRAAVDRQDPRKIFLRAFGNERDRLALSEDGGATVRVVLEVNRSLAGLVVRPDGTVFAPSRDLDGGTLFVSRDGGKTFPT